MIKYFIDTKNGKVIGSSIADVLPRVKPTADLSLFTSSTAARSVAVKSATKILNVVLHYRGLLLRDLSTHEVPRATYKYL